MSDETLAVLAMVMGAIATTCGIISLVLRHHL